MTGPTATYRLADQATDGLETFVNERRDAGQSWRRIAIALLQDHDVDVSAETLRGWFKASRAEAGAA